MPADDPSRDPHRKKDGVQAVEIKSEPQTATKVHTAFMEPIVEAPKENPVESEPEEDYFASEANVTRFYVKKRIIVGNTSKHLKRGIQLIAQLNQ